MSSELLKYLPPQMNGYVRYPWGMLALWALVVTGISVAPLPAPEVTDFPSESGVPVQSDLSGVAPAAPSIPNTALMGSTGSEIFTLEKNGVDVVFSGEAPLIRARIIQALDGEQRTLRLMSEAGKLLAVASLNVANGGITISRPDSAATNLVAVNDEGFDVLSPASERLYRVKFKEEKFNILDSKGTRIFHGKPKDGVIVVRDESDRDLRRINFSQSYSNEQQLSLSARASLPLPIETRLLLIAAALPNS